MFALLHYEAMFLLSVNLFKNDCFLYQNLSIGQEYLFLLSSKYGKKSLRKFLYCTIAVVS